MTATMIESARKRWSIKRHDYRHPSEIFAELAALWPAVAGISYERLESRSLQWPCPTPEHPGTSYLYAESFPTGRARFVPVTQGAAAAELPDADYPFMLARAASSTTGTGAR